MSDNFQNAVIRELDLRWRDPVVFALLWQKMTFCDLKLFAFSVTGETENFEPVEQSRRDSVEHIRRRDKENVRQIVINVQIVVAKRIILFRIKYFEQGRRRVAAKITSELIDFVQ